jgi:ubiquinone/menaquinone biosynthesis C-methylase UbiE
MQPQLNEIRDQQRNTWNKFSGGWKKWNDHTMKFLKSSGEAIINELDIQKTDNILDVASGTGEPAITIAGIAIEGKVTATDLAEQMLETAKENANKKALKNFETIVADVSDLPFADNSFDKISCRMGFMFFPDIQLASNEMYRVLKPGGKIATSVWFNPEKNLWMTGLMSIIKKNIPTPPQNPDAPSMFRCAKPGLMKSLLEKAGFKNIKEKEISGKTSYPDFEFLWTMMNEVAAPVVVALNNADEVIRRKVKDEAAVFAKQNTGENGIELSYCSLIISAEK